VSDLLALSGIDGLVHAEFGVLSFLVQTPASTLQKGVESMQSGSSALVHAVASAPTRKESDDFKWNGD
jgi:hypothetical protein